MRIRVDLLPSPPYEGTVVLVDVLRSCTLAPILFDNGLSRLTITSSAKLARMNHSEHLLIGEREGFPLEGFNYGCSPSELSQIDLKGQRAIMVSENAPRALETMGKPKRVLLASLYNVTAVAKRILDLASTSTTLICSGFNGAEDLDDALTAGFLAARLKSLTPETSLEGAGNFCVSLLRAFPDPLEALWQSIAGHSLRRLRRDEDLAFASLIDQSTKVPIMQHASGINRLYEFEI